ncbi:hypothetical protein ACFFLM_25935 [Deinococcus oregonensis]|uniref:Uncharacterized protein n=1 Tax=Deinococcus oregonensis TaxID=1805970 RepID=A0ABV6B6J2_9DEIO
MVATLVIVGGLRDAVAYASACMKTLQNTVEPSAVVLAIIEANQERGYRHGGRRS